MFLRMVYDEKLAQAAYLIGCQRTGEAIVIDPERDIDRYDRLAASNGLKVVAATETHIHADFVSGVRAYAAQGARVYLSDEGDADWKYAWAKPGAADGPACVVHLLHDGDVIRVGQIEIQAVHTPGHTPEHLCFFVTDRGGGADKPIGVVTGDFVFVGDLGRPDLLETAAGIAGNAETSARRLYQSVQKFMQWADYLQIWPGHGAGSACGKALGAVPQSTVGYEKQFNASLRASTSERSFLEAILEGQPEPPLYFARMKRINKTNPPWMSLLPRPKAIDVEGLSGAVDTPETVIIDTRPWPSFKAGHVPGSLTLPLTNAFNTDAGSMLHGDESIVLIIDPPRVEEAVRDLVRVGFERIERWFDAGQMGAYLASGAPIATCEEITIAEARERIASQRPFLLDVRRSAEFAQGHIPGAMNATHTRLLSRLSELPKDRPILVNCRSGQRSSRACAMLQRHGFRVTNLVGGMLAWEQAGGTIER